MVLVSFPLVLRYSWSTKSERDRRKRLAVRAGWVRQESKVVSLFDSVPPRGNIRLRLPPIAYAGLECDADLRKRGLDE